MSVIARFFVSEVTRRAYNPDAAEITLNVASRGEENKVWAAATPSGTIKMNVLNALAVEAFEIGKEYKVTFDSIADTAPASG